MDKEGVGWIYVCWTKGGNDSLKHATENSVVAVSIQV